MRKSTVLLALVLAALCTPVAFADEPAPDANPCVVECKSACYDVFAWEVEQCYEHPYPTCQSEKLYDLNYCKNGCMTHDTCWI